jgi:hypothetical protein
MASESRYYASGIEQALFWLSRGYCYEPTCRAPVIVMTGDRPRCNVHKSHIRGLNKGSARFVSSYPVADRNSFANLTLLCKPHHDEVDKPPTDRKYPIEMLLEWKHERELGAELDLSGLAKLSGDDLLAGLTDVVRQAEQRILAAVQAVDDKSQATHDMVRILLDESFQRPYLDAEAVESLASSAQALRHLEDTAPMLDHSAMRLGHLEDTSWMLDIAARRLVDLPDLLPQLDRFAETVADLDDVVRRLGNAQDTLAAGTYQLSTAAKQVSVPQSLTSALSEASDELRGYRGLVTQLQEQPWSFLKAGAAAGAVAMLIVVVLVLWGWSRLH